jgi:hypothetical protein
MCFGEGAGRVRRNFVAREKEKKKKKTEKAGKWGPLDWEKLRKINM